MRGIISFALVAVFAATISGCSKKTCETISDECDMGSTFEDACIDDYKRNSGNCRDSLKEVKKCVEDNGCDNSCDDEIYDMLDDCDDIYDVIYDYVY